MKRLARLVPIALGLLVGIPCVAMVMAPTPAAPEMVFDIRATLLMTSDGEGNTLINTRFTNLGPRMSTAFNFQVYQSVKTKSGWSPGIAVNSLQDGAVPPLGIGPQFWQKNFNLNVTRGTTYKYRLTYSPALNDANNSNHTVEIIYTAP